jgi:hypothetical protein
VGKLIEAHGGTSKVKSAKLFICKGKFEKFALLPKEELKDNFSHLNNIVNELKYIGFDVSEVDISHKFLRALPPKYEIIVTLFVRSNLKTITPSDVLGEVLTHDIFKQSQEELYDNLHEDNKIVAFKAKASNDDDSESSTDDDVALMVKKLKRFVKKKGYQGGSSKGGKSYSKNPFVKRKSFIVVKWVVSPQIARIKMKINLARRRSLKAIRNCSRSIIRRRMASHVMLSRIRMQARILTLMMMMRVM